MNTRKEQARQTYIKIISAATELSKNCSYEDLSVDQICEHAGISKGGFYHHFASKDQLITILLGCKLGNLVAERLNPFFDKENAVTLLKIYIDTMVEFVESNPRDTLVRCWLLITEHPEITADSEFSRESFQILHRIVAQGKADGSIRPELDGEFCQAFINGSLTGIILYGSAIKDTLSLQDFANKSLELICQTLQ